MNDEVLERLRDYAKLVRQQADEMNRRDEIIKKMHAEIEQLERERDAAIDDLRICCGCEACKFRLKPDCPHKTCVNHNFSNWQWRGPKEG